VLEFASAQSAVIHCFAEPKVLDLLRPPPGAMAFRIAREELICVSASAEGATVLAALSADLGSMDPHALVLNRSDAWAVFTLTGSDRANAFARLCTTRLPPPPAFLQGDIGAVPAKAVIQDDRIHLMVSSPLGHHLRQRIILACGDLDPREISPVAFAAADSRKIL
jgi:hypothetical protein